VCWLLYVESRPHARAYTATERIEFHTVPNCTSRFLLCVHCRPASRPHAYVCSYPRVPRCGMRMLSATGWACPLVLHVSWTAGACTHVRQQAFHDLRPCLHVSCSPSCSPSEAGAAHLSPSRCATSTYDLARQCAGQGRLIEPVRRSTISRRCHWRQWKGRWRREAKWTCRY